MIEVKSSEGVVDLKASGNTSVIAADLLMIVKAVYKAITKEHPGEKAVLKVFLKSCINNDMAFEEEKDGEADD